MKAIVVRPQEGIAALSWEEIPDLAPGPGEILLDIHATGVNRADLLQARGLYPPPPGESPILGLEAAGRIAAVGADVEVWQPGDRVCALVPGGGYAEQVVLPQGLLIPLPDDWSYVQAAGVPEVWLTAYSNLCMEGSIQAGETVLIHAGASGVGTAAIQLGRELDARIAVTAGSEKKLARCRKLGAKLAINYREEDFSEAVNRFTENQGVDLILDCIGGPYLERHLALLRPYGRLISIGLLGGVSAPLDMAALLMKSLILKGTRLRARSPDAKVQITREFRDHIWPLLVAGKITPVVDRVFPITSADQAHQYVYDNRNIGKVILEIRP
ncbi:MAG: NAD(P)H-quinone oxidoreductase [Desulfobacterales bacterium]|jgi:putative PIG3 family NAD(P)H quinone oxidoreductase